MTELGFALSSEEHPPNDLVRYAKMAEDAGFTFALISDHYHPWTDRQGNSPFVWSVLGAIASATLRIRVGTGVTCPIQRMHPAIIAHAAATVAAMMPGRFFLGLGTGENLNEHILGDKWQPIEIRQDMLEEAVQVLRLLWRGGEQSHIGTHFRVENARLYTLPDQAPDIYIAAAGSESAELAGRISDGLICTAPNKEVREKFDAAGSTRRPHIGQVAVCWAPSEQQARKTALEWWAIAALKGELTQELARPKQFEQACATVRAQDVAEEIVCGPDPQKHLAAIQKYLEAGFEQVYIHQIGPDQIGFFDFYRKEIMPKL